MPRIAETFPFLLITFTLAIGMSTATAADKHAVEWLRGSGKELELCLKGEVHDTNGRPAEHVTITGQLNATLGNTPLNATIEGHRFEIWIPVNRSNWYSMQLAASTTHNDSVAYLMLTSSNLRQAVVEGVTLRLKEPTRELNVKVVDKGQPVRDAHVKVELGFGAELQSRTDESGIAHFRLLPERQPTNILAWTDDFRIGGFYFDRSPPRDPSTKEHELELTACRNQRMRFVDHDGSPVPGVRFRLFIATPAPDFNFIGVNEHSVMTADENGEVIDKWFPDWTEPHFYAELMTNQWVLDGDSTDSHQMIDGVAVFKLKRSKIAERKTVPGKVKASRSWPGGFHVTLDSFQGEQEHYRDVLGTFTDADGSFAVDVLPDATYCTYVLDGRWVSNIIDLALYQKDNDRKNSPLLTVSDGQEVEVIATSGPNNQPYANLDVSFFRKHSYDYRENGKVRHGTSGPQWYVRTDEHGRAVTQVLPGEVEVMVYSPLWRTQQTVHIKAGQPTAITFHRKIDKRQMVTGRLILPEGVQIDLPEIQIQAESLDESLEEQHTLTCREDGHFSFHTLATQVGIFATSKDGTFSGSLIVDDYEVPIELQLFPAIDVTGKVVDEDGAPIAGQKIQAIAWLKGEKENETTHRGQFAVKRVETITSAIGHYVLNGLPTNVEITIWANDIDGTSRYAHLGEIVLHPSEVPQRRVSRISTKPEKQKKPPLAQQFQSIIRDCRLSGYRAIVILTDADLLTSAFVETHLRNDEANPDLYGFLPMVISSNSTNTDTADADYLKSKNWKQPNPGHLSVYVFDETEKQLGQLDVDIANKNAISDVAAFLQKHAPARIDAQKTWDDAFAEAKRSNRRVWARTSQRYCNSCFLFARWLDDHHELLKKDYVMLQVDGFRDLHGPEIAERITRGTKHVAPFSAIFDANGELPVDSVSSTGNVGFPRQPEGIKQFQAMLLKSRTNLTRSEIDQVIESLNAQCVHEREEEE